jgi:hypothetical protein
MTRQGHCQATASASKWNGGRCFGGVGGRAGGGGPGDARRPEAMTEATANEQLDPRPGYLYLHHQLEPGCGLRAVSEECRPNDQ